MYARTPYVDGNKVRQARQVRWKPKWMESSEIKDRDPSEIARSGMFLFSSLSFPLLSLPRCILVPTIQDSRIHVIERERE